jgi:hypothetical protein
MLFLFFYFLLLYHFYLLLFFFCDKYAIFVNFLLFSLLFVFFMLYVYSTKNKSFYSRFKYICYNIFSSIYLVFL